MGSKPSKKTTTPSEKKLKHITRKNRISIQKQKGNRTKKKKTPTLVRRCARRLAVCASFGRCAASQVEMSRTLWWPCPRGRPRPPLRSEGRTRGRGTLDVMAAVIKLSIHDITFKICKRVPFSCASSDRWAVEDKKTLVNI